MDETDIIVGGLLSRVAAICENVEEIVVTASVASDRGALTEIRAKLMDAVALVDATCVIITDLRSRAAPDPQRR